VLQETHPCGSRRPVVLASMGGPVLQFDNYQVSTRGRAVGFVKCSAVALMALAACGESRSADPPEVLAQTPTTTSGTATPVAPTNAIADPPAATTASPQVLGGGAPVGITCTSERIQLFRVVDDSAVLTTDVDLRSILDGWYASSDPVDCSRRASFSADWSLVAFSAVPPGGDNNHVGVIDMRNGAVQDLTQPRQGSEFSSETLWEDYPHFLGSSDSTIRFGSDQLLFFSRNQQALLRIEVDNPQLPPEKVANDWSDLVGHHEQNVGFYDHTIYNNASQINLTGTLLASGIDTTGLPMLATDRACDSEVFLGWVSSEQYAVWTYDAQLVIVTPTGVDSELCSAGLIPPNDRILFDPWLSFDRQTVYFFSSSASGQEEYAISVQGGEPVLAARPALPDGIQFYFGP